MSDTLPASFDTTARRQPTQQGVAQADGVFVRRLHIPDEDSYVPQHSHRYDHLTMLAVGSMRVWQDGVLRGDFAAPAEIVIPAGAKHVFLTLTPGVTFYCIHNTGRCGAVEELEQHELPCSGDCGRCRA